MMDGDPENPHVLTWAALLGRWMEFARSAVALPETGEGGRWRSSVPSVIALQAMVHALSEADTLSGDERAVAIDKGELLIREHARTLNEAWVGEPIPPQLSELIDDAQRALRAVREAGTEWIVGAGSPSVGDPAPLGDALSLIGFDGELWLARPGVNLGPGAIAAYARDRSGGGPSAEVRDAIESFLGGFGTFERSPTLVQRQAYRVPGQPPSFVVVPMDGDLPPGQPVLVRVGGD